MNTREAILQLMSSAIHGEQCRLAQDVDWKALIDECDMQAVQATAFFALKPESVPAEIYRSWKMKIYQVMSQNVQRKVAHAKLTKLLEDHAIQFTTFKGVASAQYYPKEGHRTIGDVDFYVASKDFDRCHELLIENGFSFETKDRDHDWSYYRNGIHYEMHFKLPGFSGVHQNEFDMEEMIRSSQLIDGIRVPSAYFHGVIILLHMASHLLSEGIGLRHLCDWAVFVDQFSNEEYEKLFKTPFERLGVWRFSQIITLTCIKYLGIHEKACVYVQAADSVVDGTMDEILCRGNFGRKIEDDMSGMLVSDGFSAKVSKRNSIVQLLFVGIDATKQHWPVSDKIRILIPFGCIFFGVRYFIRMIFGKRKKLDLLQMSHKANERRSLYEQYRLFENDQQ